MNVLKVLIVVHRTVLTLLEVTLAHVNLDIGCPAMDVGVQVCTCMHYTMIIA